MLLDKFEFIFGINLVDDSDQAGAFDEKNQR
jgi:hypothetical protein